MRIAKWFVSTGLSLALLSGAFAAPVFADQASRTGDPDLVSLQETAEEILQGMVRSARATYAEKVKAARTQRATGLAVPKADLAAALKQARTKAERRLARRAYDLAAAPVIREYRTAKSVLLAERDSTIDNALAVYLETTGKAAIAEALTQYREATVSAGKTLDLALASGRATLKTDTANARTRLIFALEEAASEDDRQEAWLDFQAEAAAPQAAYVKSVASARATYASAMSEARGEFTRVTGLSIKKLLKLPFRI